MNVFQKISNKAAEFQRIPTSILNEELEGIYGSSVLKEIGEVIEYYRIYEKGSEFDVEGTNGDYTPSELPFKLIHNLIDKEARFLFSKTPDFYIQAKTPDQSEPSEALKKQESQLKSFVDSVLNKNKISSNLLKAAKDCFIGKRVAGVLTFNDNGIFISFIPSTEFIYDINEDSMSLEKFIAFYTITDGKEKQNQRVYKKKYWMQNGFCYYNEKIYDGNGVLIETRTEDKKTELEFIPAVVIVNDGLSGDILGRSEVQELCESEAYYTKLANADIDAERKGMNPVRYTIDMAPNTTKGLSSAAGAYWDLQRNLSLEGASPAVGILEASMSYSSVLAETLNRIKTSMHEAVDVPDLTSDKLQGLVTSGKTIKALYYPLLVRCDEKMLSWRPALEEIVYMVIEGARKYPQIISKYTEESTIPDIEYDIKVENQYPLPEDEAEEKQIDMAEVGNQLMSRKAYLKKWRGLNDKQADEEIKQIIQELSAFEAIQSGGFNVPEEAEEGNVQQ